MKTYLYLLVLVLVYSCANKTEKEVSESSEEISSTASVHDSKNQTIPFYSFEEFEARLGQQDDKTYVINFWATWCKPCVKELPYFENLNAAYKDKNVEVLLVSMDFLQHIETKLIPFIDKYDIQSEVVVLDDAKSHKWIPKIDEAWSGAIPATVIYNKNVRKFYERSFTYEELEAEVQQFLN
ncbi:TlpA disulfide reductase family protein [Spongiivirga sp. MCCC 1A20706]|uniref:TlpA disulfide reductase family protein n=1 Tax=Spongiivirga sp. MCCC 1A20706 TaxID=3160963 RepID=UPI0039775746